MYRFEVRIYDTTSRRRIHALFEQEAGGKTERLVNTGLSMPLPMPVRKLSHADMLQDLDGYVPLLLQMLAARLDVPLDETL